MDRPDLPKAEQWNKSGASLRKEFPFLQRFSKLVSLLLSMRIFVLLLFTATLYISTYFLFRQEESLRQFVFDYKVHGIILCSLLSIAAGGIINTFYDLEKDRVQRPFRARLQGFLKQKYFLYSYLSLNLLSLGIAFFLSPRIFLFFLVYQFLMWFYSHKLSKWMVVNNLSFVSLTLYPFFGMLVYYSHFSLLLFSMAIFLFIVLLVVDITKDFLTLRPDALFGYATMPLNLGIRTAAFILAFLLVLGALSAVLVLTFLPVKDLLYYYFFTSIAVLLLGLLNLIRFRLKKMFWMLTFYRLWIFVGVLTMLINGIFYH